MFRKDKRIILLNSTSLCLMIFFLLSKLLKRKKSIFGSLDTAYSLDNSELFKKISTV